MEYMEAKIMSNMTFLGLFDLDAMTLVLKLN